MNCLSIQTPLTSTWPDVKCLKLRHIRMARRRLQAQTTVEFSLICLPFFAILFALIDYSQIYFYENMLIVGVKNDKRNHLIHIYQHHYEHLDQ